MKNLYKNLPPTPGVYLMKNSAGAIIYIGKAGNLKRRVASYFQRAGDWKTEKLVSEIKKIDYEKTDTALEALILEAKLIKRYEPKFNVLEKDDKSFLYVEITKEEFPRVLLVRGREIDQAKSKSVFYGPFIQGGSLKEALKIVRRIFPFSIHPSHEVRNIRIKSSQHSHYVTRPCFNYQIGLCPGVCAGAISKEQYRKTIANIKLFFEGKKKKILRNLKKEMAKASKSLEFEKAAELKRQIFALTHIQDIALIRDNELTTNDQRLTTRIEGYDISNISGVWGTGSMVVFKGENLDKSQYRKFKIQNFKEPNDVGMLKEVLRRRLKNDWPLPDLVLIDGGLPQVNAARAVFLEAGLKIPIVGIAKGPTRKKNEFIGRVPLGFDPRVLIRVRDEAHRFAVSYHRKLRSEFL